MEATAAMRLRFRMAASSAPVSGGAFTADAAASIKLLLSVVKCDSLLEALDAGRFKGTESPKEAVGFLRGTDSPNFAAFVEVPILSPEWSSNSETGSLLVLLLSLLASPSVELLLALYNWDLGCRILWEAVKDLLIFWVKLVLIFVVVQEDEEKPATGPEKQTAAAAAATDTVLGINLCFVRGMADKYRKGVVDRG